MSTTALQLLAACATAGAVAIGTFWVLARQPEPVAAARMRRLLGEPERRQRGISWEELRRGGLAGLPLMRNFVLQSSWAERLRLEIEQAGLRLHVSEYLAGRFALALLAFVPVALAGRSVPTFILALALA